VDVRSQCMSHMQFVHGRYVQAAPGMAAKVFSSGRAEEKMALPAESWVVMKRLRLGRGFSVSGLEDIVRLLSC
jgi:hypothetical protein